MANYYRRWHTAPFNALPNDWQEGDGAMNLVARTFLLDSSEYPNGQVVGYEYETRDNMTFSRSENGEHIVQRVEAW